jgi:hypothetical protein
MVVSLVGNNVSVSTNPPISEVISTRSDHRAEDTNPLIVGDGAVLHTPCLPEPVSLQYEQESVAALP